MAQLFKNLDCINYVSLVVMELNVLPVLVAASGVMSHGNIWNRTWGPAGCAVTEKLHSPECAGLSCRPPSLSWTHSAR